MSAIRLMTSNIQSGLSASGARTSEEELAAAYAHVDVDVAVLQEVDRGQRRSGGIDQLAVIAQALGLEHTRYGAALGSDLRVRRSPAKSVGAHVGPAYGIALASRYPVIAWFALRLPRAASHLPVWQRGRLGWWTHEPRVAIIAVLDGPAGAFVAACTHLSLVTPVALGQLRTVLERVESLGLPAVVAGDFNLRYTTVRRAVRGWNMAIAQTFPADAPDRQIDHILTSGFHLHDARTERLIISDHRAMFADLAVA